MEQLSQAERLVKYGFFKKGFNQKYVWNPKKKIYMDEKNKESYTGKDANEEFAEEVNIQATMSEAPSYLPTGYPKPYRRYKVVLEAPNMDIQETYFWILTHLRQDQSFPYVDKITDIFSASEQSAFFGQSAQRLGIQQDRASQYLASIGKMVKDIFPLVRELRILDERLDPYSKADKLKSADVTLKGLYVDLVEQGTKNPASVIGMAQQVGFTSLPDFFFNTWVKKADELDQKIGPLKTNVQVKNVLRRKLYAYMTWKEKTEKELETRKIFTLKYLRQHWETIKMYMAWVKPYLKTVQRMTMNKAQQDSPDLIGAFETAMTEIEFLAKKPQANGTWAVIIATFKYNTKPLMQYQQDYQRGPQHVGKVEFTLRSYGWTKEQIDNYKRMRQEEEMYLLGSVDEAIQEAMDSFGDELDKYLEQAGAYIEKEEESEDDAVKRTTFKDTVDPFVSVAKGFGDVFGSLLPIKIEKKKKSSGPGEGDLKGAAKNAYKASWGTYKNYKKSHKLLAW